MNVQETVKQQLGFWHGTLNGMMSDCGDALNKPVAGATINSVAAIYAHAVWSEDAIVNGMLRGKPLIYTSDGWEGRTGVKFPGAPPAMADWGKTIQMDFPKFKEYADAVFANTDAYLAKVTDTELEEKTQTPLGEQPKTWVVSVLLGTHLTGHAGEIAAVKGVHGLKGLPF